MRGRACVITVLVLASTSLPARGQSVAPARTATKTWTAPRMADGRPDLQGVWLIHTATPLERPAALAGRSTLTDEEVAEFRRRAARLFGSGNSDFAVGDGVFQAVLANPATYTNPNSTHGFQCYYVPLRAGAIKTYSNDYDNFTCCHGTGMETNTKHGFPKLTWYGVRVQ